ncbi:MAG: heme-binding domain-containing protein [Bryobacteraceae bacterium]
MNWKHAIGVAGLMAALTVGALQVIPGPKPSNPPVAAHSRLETHVSVPPIVAGVIERACRDCHTNETRWPWYSRIAPASWAVAGDVNKARESLNFSYWSERNGKTPGSAMGTLTAACANVQGGRMPLPRYTMLHPEAKLSKSEVEAFCAWTKTETRRLAEIQRERHKQLAATPAETPAVN